MREGQRCYCNTAVYLVGNGTPNCEFCLGPASVNVKRASASYAFNLLGMAQRVAEQHSGMKEVQLSDSTSYLNSHEPS